MNLNKQFTILFASCIALLSMGVSCKDKNNSTANSCEQNPGTCQTVLEAKDYFLFNNGSWWVYEEETTHERDSMYVTEYTNSSGYDFDCRIKSALTGYEYHYWPFYAGGNPNCSQTAPNAGKCLYIKRSKGQIGDFVGENDCFFFTYKLNDWIYVSSNQEYPNNKIIISDILYNHEIGNLSFSKTVKVHELYSFLEGKQEVNFYYSNGIGLIKKELLDSNQVWNLVNYHIQE